MKFPIILLMQSLIQTILSMQWLTCPEKTAVNKRDKVPALMEMRL